MLLFSFGGAIVTAPVVLPLLAWSAWSTPSPRLRLLAAVVAGLTTAEVAWAAVYLVYGERGPWIVAVPLMGGAFACAVLVRTKRKAPSGAHPDAL